MKVEIECAECIIHRGVAELKEATDDPNLRFKAIRALFTFLAEEFKPTAVPAYLGTQRDRIVRRVTGNPDPYAERKRLSNEKALEALLYAEELVRKASTPEARFRRACLCSIVGNIIEFDIHDHVFQFGDLEKLIKQSEKDLAIDDIPKIFELAKKARLVLYMTDNAGEIVFDKLLVKELKLHGAEVVVAVKGGPILNDATLVDAKFVGMNEIADEIITTGTDSVGLNIQESSKQFLEIYNSADLIIAKGMGYAETLTEDKLTRPHALLLRTKCGPVANFLGVPMEKNVAKILP